MGFKLRDQSDSPSDPGDLLSGPAKIPEIDPEATSKKKKPLRRSRVVAAKGLAVLPSLLTIANGLCGFAAIFLASRPLDPPPLMPFGWTPLTFSALFIFLGMVFDALDGTVARMTGQTSDLGGQLDSMSDMVTFGVAPAFLAVQLIRVGIPFLSVDQDHWYDRLTLLIAGIYVASTALRLARFNIEIDNPEEKDHLSFKGLPSPGAAGTVASLILLHQHLLANFRHIPWSIQACSVAMVFIMLLVAFAMVSRLRYAHVVNRYVRGRAPVETIAVVVSIGLLLAIWPQRALAAGLVFYALSAPIMWVVSKIRRRPIPAAASTAPEAQEKKAQDSD